MTTSFTNQCAEVSKLANQLQEAMDALKPQLGDLPNTSIIKIANEVARGVPRTVAAPNPVSINAAMAQDTKAPKTNGTAVVKTSSVADPILKLPRVVRKVARAARDKYQGKEFAMADIGIDLKVGSRKLIPTFNSLEKKGFFKKVGRDKRNGQEVNIYRLGKPLATA